MSNNIVSFISLLLCAHLVTYAVADDTDADKIRQRREALDWLTAHVGDQQLLKPLDFKALHDKVANMSEAEFLEWIRETRELRKALESQAWRETRAWLREFLAVQAIYSDQDIDDFKTKAANMSPSELLDAMRQVRRKYQSLLSMHAASQRSRKTNLRLRDDLIRRQQQAASHAAALHTAGFHQHSGFATPAPIRSTYAERMNVYRRIGFWPGGFVWWNW